MVQSVVISVTQSIGDATRKVKECEKEKKNIRLNLLILELTVMVDCFSLLSTEIKCESLESNYFQRKRKGGEGGSKGCK